MFDWLFGTYEKDRSPDGVDDRVYQRENGTMYIDSGEFARSEEGQKLLKRFSEHVDESDTIHQD